MTNIEAAQTAHKTVWMVSGNKGGVGKSLFCLALASALEAREEHFAILDGDGRTSDVYATFLRKCPALSADFRELRPESNNCSRDAEYEGFFYQLLSASPNLIINTPDGADALLMKWFDKTLSFAETLNYQFKFMYLMSERPDGLEILPELASKFAFFYPIRNLHFGEPGLFTFFNRNYARIFHEILDFPVLRSEELRMLFDVKTYPNEALNLKDDYGNYTIPTLSRSRIQTWQVTVTDALDNIIDNKIEPNTLKIN